MTQKRKFLTAVILTAAMLIISNAVNASAAENTEKRKSSVRSELGSLAQTDEGRELLTVYDETFGYAADPSADAYEAIESTNYKENGFTKKDLKYLSAIVYCEANSMCFEAQVAVANVVLNRMRDTDPGEWGHVNTIKEVIYDRRWNVVHFEPTRKTSDGSPSYYDKALALYSSMDETKYKDWEIREMNDSIKAALAALKGYKTIPDHFMYFNGHLPEFKKNARKDQKKICMDNGYPFSIMGTHIYFIDKKQQY